jgi:hypothetical protein
VQFDLALLRQACQSQETIESNLFDNVSVEDMIEHELGFVFDSGIFFRNANPIKYSTIQDAGVSTIGCEVRTAH